jgi:hypothetical protein
MTKHTILVRFNHEAKCEDERWRFVWNSVEHTCASVTFNCATETCREEVQVEDKLVTKWHIRPIQANHVELIEKEGASYFIVT